MEWLNKIGKKYSTKSHIQCPGHKSHTATSERPDAVHLSQERPGFQPGHVFPHQPSAWEGFSWGSSPSWVLGVHCFITQGTEIAKNHFLMMLVLCFLDDVLTSGKKGSSSRSNLCSPWSGSGSLFSDFTLGAHSSECRRCCMHRGHFLILRHSRTWALGLEESPGVWHRVEERASLRKPCLRPLRAFAVL